MRAVDGIFIFAQSLRLLTNILREQVVDPTVESHEDIPRRIDQINPQWLTAVLCKDNPTAKVLRVEFGGGSTGTSDRRLISVTYNEAGKKANLPSSIFCKATPGFFTSLGHSAAGSMAGETWFYQSIKPKLTGESAIESPTGYHSRHDLKGSKSIHLIEDVVQSKGASFDTVEASIDLDRIRGMVGTLASLHGAFYRSDLLHTEFRELQNFTDMFCKANRILNGRKYHIKGIEKARYALPDVLYQRREESWSAILKANAVHDGRAPQTIVHCDVHLANWYICANGEMGLTDWQFVSRGHWSRDLAYCIGSALSIENRRAWEQDLIHYYLDCFKKVSSVQIPYEGAWKSYSQQMASALSFWTTTYAPPALAPSNMQPDPLSHEMVRRLGTAVVDLNTLDLLSPTAAPSPAY